jgi:urease accessory protein
MRSAKTGMRMVRGTAMADDAVLGDGLATPALLKLMTFLSPAFPVGAFSYSHGVEWLIDRGDIRTADALASWIAELLARGSLWNDAVLFVSAYRGAHRAVQLGANAELLEVAELAEALAGSRERHVEAMAQGRAFLEAVAAAWPCAIVDSLAKEGAAYPVAVGAFAAAHDVALEAALPAYLNAFVANLVSVGVRLVPLGQSAGLQILASQHPLIATTAHRAEACSLDDLGSAAVLSDIASMRHETQYSRVFRT